MKKYLVTVEYKPTATMKHRSEVFEFDNTKDRDLFIHDIKPAVKEVLMSEIEEDK